MSQANKKQRHKSKRDAKKKAARRQNSISPIKRLADARGEIECWRRGEFETERQISFFVHKRGGGLSGVACFLVDRGVVGLKDAFCRLPISGEELDYMLSAGKANGVSTTKCSVEEVRRVVAGGIRYAHDNGMRLPKDWVKVASIIGGVGDWASADVSEFSREFMGHPEDLRRRLISEPFEDYIQRTDITFLLADTAPLMDLETGEYEQTGDDAFDDEEFDGEKFDGEAFNEAELEDLEFPLEELQNLETVLSKAANSLAEETSQWVISLGEQPGSELESAWMSFLTTSMLCRATKPDGADDEVEELGETLLNIMAAQVEPSRLEEYERSKKQAVDHMEADPMLIANAVKKQGKKLPPR